MCSFCGFILLGLYVFTLYPSLAGGDSGELIVSAQEFGVAHPPGYPLFTILTKIFITLIPFGSIAWRANLMNALFSVLASVFLQLSILRLTKCVGSSLLVYAFLSLNKLMWKWSACAEVFGLNNFFCTLIIFLLIWSESSISQKKHSFDKKLYVLGLICGLSLTNQHTMVFPVCLVAIWVLVQLKRSKKFNCGTMLKLTLCGILGLSPYLYLPLSSTLNIARWTWGDQSSLKGFLNHLLRNEYGTFNLAKDQIGSSFIDAISLYGSHLQHRMCELCPWLSLIGLVTGISWSCIGKHSSTLVVMLMTISYILFFCWRSNLDLGNPIFVGVVERFWMQSDIGFVLIAAIGYHTAIRLVTEKFLGSSKIAMTSVFTTMGSIVLIVLQLKNISLCDQSSNLVVHNFAKITLNSLPRNSLILTRGDLPSNSMRYLHLCESFRPDLILLDVEILSYEWSLPMLKKFYHDINFPGDVWNPTNNFYANGKKAFNFKSFLDANIEKRHIFACIGMQDKDNSWMIHYNIWPYGICSAIKPISEAFFPAEWANRTGGIADKWSYPYTGFDKTSWDNVANDEMWHSKIGTAFFLYKSAQETGNPDEKLLLLMESYKLYFRAIKLHQLPSRMNYAETFPSFWHKNFALVCEKLLHVDLRATDLDKVKLCKLSTFHFEQYLHLKPEDPDIPKIVEAINILKERLNVFENLEKVDKTLEKSIRRVQKMEKIAEQAKTSSVLLHNSLSNP